MEKTLASWYYKNGELFKDRFVAILIPVFLLLIFAGLFFLINNVLHKGELAQLLAYIWAISLFCILFQIIFRGLLSSDNNINSDDPEAGFTNMIIVLISLLYLKIAELLSLAVYQVYKKLVPLKEEQIIFTNQKIDQSRRCWKFNEDYKLEKVLFDPSKKNMLEFHLSQSKKGEVKHYNLSFPVPEGEEPSAQIVADYFTTCKEEEKINNPV